MAQKMGIQLILLNCIPVRASKVRSFWVCAKFTYHIYPCALNLQEQKFSCVTQHMTGAYIYKICNSRNFLVLLNIVKMICPTLICNSRNFLVLLNPSYYSVNLIICNSRNFLVLLNHHAGASSIQSAIAEIFLCYSTEIACRLSLSSAIAEIFLCYSTPTSSYCTSIC